MALTLTSAARAVLEGRIAQSTVANPVILFVRIAADFRSDMELKRLLASPDADESAVRRKFLNLNPDPTTLSWRWAPAIYSQDPYPDEMLYETDGIKFLLPGPMRERLKNASLDVDRSGFLFRSDGQLTEPF